MPLEVGKIYGGKVDKITDYGAFIKLNDGGSGLCHISEVASGFVKKVSDVLELNQEVKVKVLAMKGEKVNLSIKQTEISFEKKKETREPRKTTHNNRSNDRQDFRSPNKATRGGGFKQKSGGGFEDMLDSFIKTSDDRQRPVKKSSKSRKGNGYNR